MSIDGTASTSRSVDSELVRTGWIVATSDAPIMARADRLIDLARISIKKLSNVDYCMIDLQKLVWIDWHG